MTPQAAARHDAEIAGEWLVEGEAQLEGVQPGTEAYEDAMREGEDVRYEQEASAARLGHPDYTEHPEYKAPEGWDDGSEKRYPPPPDKPIGTGKNGYVIFHGNQRYEVYADTSYEAAKRLAEFLGKKGTAGIEPVLAEKEGKQVTHLPLFSLAARHYGPGTHPGTGTEQTVHGGGGGGQQARRGGTPRRELSVFERNQLKVAQDTLRYSDVGAQIMGGMTKEEAREVIKRLTGRAPREGSEKRYPTSEFSTPDELADHLIGAYARPSTMGGKEIAGDIFYDDISRRVRAMYPRDQRKRSDAFSRVVDRLRAAGYWVHS